MTTSLRRFGALALALGLSATACSDSETTEPSAAVAPVTSTADSGSAQPASSSADADEPVVTAAAQTSAPPTVANADYLGDYTLVDEAFGTMVTVTVDGDTRTILSNSLPNHETGEFPNSGNPNAIAEQDLSFEYPATGVSTGEASFAQTPGIGLNGVTFEPGTAETATCATGETYRIEALQDLYDLGLDFNNAHVQPGGQYHYHGVSELLVDAFDNDEDLVLVGFAADGFLMLYSKSGAYESGYELSSTARTGSDCLISGPDGTVVDLEGTAPDGTYASDFEYVGGNLDECNGTEIDGQYVYLLTDEYPYIPRCLMGDAAAGGPDGPPPGEGNQP